MSAAASLGPPRHARDVVRGVALEAVEVWHQVGGDAVVEVVDALGSHDLDLGDALLGRDDLYVFGCQLVHVAVAGEEQHFVTRFLPAAGKGAQDVVALPALELADRHVKHAEQVLHHGELLVEGLVHGRALRLVLGELLHAHLGLALVEGADDAVGTEGFDHLDEHVEEPKEGIGRATVRRGHGLHDGVVGTVHERVAVDDGYGSARGGRGGRDRGGGFWHESVPSRVDQPILPRSQTEIGYRCTMSERYPQLRRRWEVKRQTRGRPMNDRRVIMHQTALPCTNARVLCAELASLHVLSADPRVSQFNWHYMLYEFACIKLHVVIAT